MASFFSPIKTKPDWFKQSHQTKDTGTSKLVFSLQCSSDQSVSISNVCFTAFSLAADLVKSWQNANSKQLISSQRAWPFLRMYSLTGYLIVKWQIDISHLFSHSLVDKPKFYSIIILQFLSMPKVEQTCENNS